jgi:hypothetical protein
LLRQILTQARQGLPRSEWKLQSETDGEQTDGLVNWLVQEGYLRSKGEASDHFLLMPKAVEFLDQWQPREQIA